MPLRTHRFATSKHGAATLALVGTLASCGPAPESDLAGGSSLRRLTPPPSTRLVVATLQNASAPLVEDPDGILIAQLLQLFLDGGDVEVYAPDQTALLELQGLLSTDPTAHQADRIRELTGAEALVTGGLHTHGASLEIELTLASTTDSSTTLISGATTDANVLPLIEHLAMEVRRALGAAVDTSESEQTLRSWLPLESSALRAISGGRRRLWLSDPSGAAELLAHAAMEEPRRALIRLELARALLALGSFGRAREEARRATELAPEAPADELLDLRVLAAHIEGHPRRAAELQLERLAARPWATDSRFALVRTLLETGDGRAAFAAIAELRSLPLGVNDRLRIDLLAARAAQNLGDNNGWLLLAESARDRAVEAGLPLFEAEAWISVGEARLALGHGSAAHDAAQRAREIFLRFSHRRQGAMALALAAMGRLTGGTRSDARELLQQAAGELRRERDPRNVANVLNNLGLLELQDGDLGAAEDRLRESLDLRRSLADSIGSARTLVRLAEVRSRRGHFEDIDALCLEALALVAEDGLSPLEGPVALELAARLGVRGKAPSVQATRIQVRTAAIEAGDRRLEALARSDIGELLLGQGELESARLELERALALFAELDDGGGNARARFLLARLAAEEGAFGEASSLAEQVVEWALGAKDAALEAAARTILAWSHLEHGRRRAAADQAALARETATEVADPVSRLSVLVDAARLEAVLGDAAEASGELRRLGVEARALGLVRTALETELARAEIEIRGDDPGAAQRRLAKVAEDADGAGWLLLASRARRAADAGLLE